MQTTAHEVLEIVRQRGMIRARDLAAWGISPTHLQRLYEQGLLERSGRGIYIPVDAPSTRTPRWPRWPCGCPPVSCLYLSALQFHGATTQAPHQVWIALPPRAISRASTTRRCG